MGTLQKMLFRGWLLMLLEKFKQGQQYDVQRELETAVEFMDKELADGH